MAKNSIKNSYEQTRRLGMLILFSCIFIVVGIYGWTYQTSLYHKEEKELLSYNTSLEKAFAMIENLNIDARRWEKDYDIESETLTNTQLRELDLLITEMGIESTPFSKSLEKNIAYWRLASDYALRISILNSEANTSFYNFLGRLDESKQGGELLSIISRLPMENHVFLDELSENSYSVLKRDIIELIKISSYLKNELEHYLEIIENIWLQKTKVLPLVIDLNNERYSIEYNLKNAANILKEKNNKQQKELKNQKKETNNILYIYLICLGFFIIWRIFLSANLIRKENKKIARINAYLKEKLKASQLAENMKTNFLSIISYESRASLNIIMGLTRFANEKSANSEQKAKLTQIITASENLNLLLNDVMELIDFEMERITLDSDPFSPKKVIELIINKYQKKAKAKAIIFEFSLDKTINDVYIGDQKRFYQLIDYLLSNAFTYTETGHISLKVSADSGKNFSSHMQRINFQLEDTGIQSSPEDIKTLFKPFSIVNLISSRKSGATGVHLSIVSYLIKLMGGDIEATIPAYKGMQYNFHLNLEIDEIGQPPIAIDDLLDSGKSKEILTNQILKVLIVEDCTLNAFFLKWMLEGQKHEVTIAKNGIECINIIEKSDFDIIFMDQYMPEMDGIEATKKIRAYDNYKSKIPIIGCTADAFQETRYLLLSAGQNDVIHKPVSNEVVSEIIKSLLAGKYNPTKIET